MTIRKGTSSHSKSSRKNKQSKKRTRKSKSQRRSRASSKIDDLLIKTGLKEPPPPPPSPPPPPPALAIPDEATDPTPQRVLEAMKIKGVVFENEGESEKWGLAVSDILNDIDATMEEFVDITGGEKGIIITVRDRKPTPSGGSSLVNRKFWLMNEDEAVELFNQKIENEWERKGVFIFDDPKEIITSPKYLREEPFRRALEREKRREIEEMKDQSPTQQLQPSGNMSVNPRQVTVGTQTYSIDNRFKEELVKHNLLDEDQLLSYYVNSVPDAREWYVDTHGYDGLSRYIKDNLDSDIPVFLLDEAVDEHLNTPEGRGQLFSADNNEENVDGVVYYELFS